MTSTITPDQLRDASAAVDEADLSVEKAEEKAEELRAKVEELREEVRNGHKLPRKTLADAEGDADHAELEIEAAKRARQKLYDARRQLRTEHAEASLADPDSAQAVAAAQSAISAAVATLLRVVPAHNAHQAKWFNELRQLEVFGYDRSFNRSHRFDLSKVITTGIFKGAGGDMKRIRDESDNAKLANLVYDEGRH